MAFLERGEDGLLTEESLRRIEMLQRGYGPAFANGGYVEPELRNSVVKPVEYNVDVKAVRYDGTEECAWGLVNWTGTGEYRDGVLWLRPTDDEGADVEEGTYVVKGLDPQGSFSLLTEDEWDGLSKRRKE